MNGFYILSVCVGGKKMASQHSSIKNKSRIFAYNFNEKWENKYFFFNVNKCACLICNASVSVGKKCNVERNSTTTQKST
jgi:hypothetical protein